MSIYKVTVNGKAHIVDAATKAAAKAYGAKKLEVEVVPAAPSDLVGIDLSTVETVLAKGAAKTPAAAESTEVGAE